MPCKLHRVARYGLDHSRSTLLQRFIMLYVSKLIRVTVLILSLDIVFVNNKMPYLGSTNFDIHIKISRT